MVSLLPKVGFRNDLEECFPGSQTHQSPVEKRSHQGPLGDAVKVSPHAPNVHVKEESEIAYRHGDDTHVENGCGIELLNERKLKGEIKQGQYPKSGVDK